MDNVYKYRKPFPEWLGRLGDLAFRITGWTRVGAIPDDPRMVIIAAPHTSSWDFPVLIFSAWSFRMHIRWVGKHSLFWGPMGIIMRKLGGIPVDRRSPQNTVDQLVDILRKEDALLLGIAPEGTRKKMSHWKSGFYHIARGAEVPILLAFADFARKESGVGPTLIPSGDIEADMIHIRNFYEDKQGRHPEKQSDIRLASAQSIETPRS